MFHPCAKKLRCICDPRFHVGEAAMEGRALDAFAARVELYSPTRGPLVMCATRCDCDLGKKNVTAGLYFQQIFLNIN